MAAGIKLTNLNSRLSGPQEKAVKGGKQAAGFLTGPTRTSRNFQNPNPLVSEFIDNNPNYPRINRLKYLAEHKMYLNTVSPKIIKKWLEI